MKKYFIACVCAFCLSVSSQAAVLNTSSMASVQMQNSQPKDAGVQFLKTFYLRFILDDMQQMADYYTKRLTANARKKLADDYEYDCMQGECLAWWMFSNTGQDPDINSMRRSLKITPVGKGWYNVNMVDAGNLILVKVKLVKKNKSFFIDDYVAQ